MKFQVWRGRYEESMFSPAGMTRAQVRLMTHTNDLLPVKMKLVLEFEAKTHKIASKFYKRWRGGGFARNRP